MDSIVLFSPNSVENIVFESGKELNHVIDSEGSVWISLTDCSVADTGNRNRITKILASKSFTEYLEEIDRGRYGNLSTQEALIKVVKSSEETELFKRGTYLNISDEDGQDLFLYIAQELSPRFRRWCSSHIRNILNKGYSISERITNNQIAGLQEKLEQQLTINLEQEATIHLAQKERKKLVKRNQDLAIRCDLLEKNKIYSEEHLQNLLQQLFSFAGLFYCTEDYYNLSNGKIVRFDLLRKVGRLVDIIELKKVPITYQLIAEELFFKKNYAAALSEKFPTRRVSITFLGLDVQVEQDDLESLIDNLPANIDLKVQRIDSEYFEGIFHKHLRKKISQGSTFHQVRQQWQQSVAPQIIQTILA
jgi:hypothetical protein